MYSEDIIKELPSELLPVSTDIKITNDYLEEAYPNVYQDYQNSNFFQKDITEPFRLRYFFDAINLNIQIIFFIPLKYAKGKREYIQEFTYAIYNNGVHLVQWAKTYKNRKQAENASILHCFELAQFQINYHIENKVDNNAK